MANAAGMESRVNTRHGAPDKTRAHVHDVCVLGAGPAGLSAAHALARAGLDVCVLDPAPSRPWAPTYGMWQHEATALGLDDMLAHIWPRVQARGTAWDAPIDAGYVMLDNARTKAHLLAAGFAAVPGRVLDVRASTRETPAAVQYTPSGSERVPCDAQRDAQHDAQHDELQGHTLHCHVVLDAMGTRSPLLTADAATSHSTIRQRALGQVLAGPHGLPADRAVFMDWRAPGGAQEPWPGPPTFAYVLPMGPDRVLLEETILASHTAPERAWFEPRLAARRTQYGLDGLRVAHTEWVDIRMDRPGRQSPVLATGAAGGLVHPATGYAVARSMRAAVRLGPALAGAIRRGVRGPALRRVGARALRPAGDAAKTALYHTGLHVLSKHSTAEANRFFAAFFRMPPATWMGFQTGQATTTGVMATMARVFGTLDMPGRALLVRHSLSGAAAHLTR